MNLMNLMSPPLAPGRTCPLHYRYQPTAFAVPAAARCEVLYVVGGLYGNEPALGRVLDLFARERGDKRMVFNGDFHWFDVSDAAFAAINAGVLGFDATRGNVETELATSAGALGAGDAGCGCAYPAWVGDGVVQRSNQIMARLRATAQRAPAAVRALQALPMWRRIDVGGRRIAVVHGDAESLAGWGFAAESLQDPTQRERVRAWFEAAEVDAFACTHTCLPVFQTLPAHGAAFAPIVLNNGAAGMPNLRGAREGLLTRIAITPFGGPERRFGVERGGLFMDGIAVAYDEPQWHAQFLAQWPGGSAAHTSYWPRISTGVTHALGDVLRGGAGE